MVQDKHRKEELWITTMNPKEGELKLILLKVVNRNIVEPTQQYITWEQNTTSKFILSFSDYEINIKVNDNPSNTISIKRFLSRPSHLVIGDCDNTLGTSVKSFISLSYAPNSTDVVNMACYLVDINGEQN